MSNQPIEGAVTSPVGVRRNFPEGESGHHLLKRILENRRAKWEAHELERMQAQGNRRHTDEWKKKYKEPAPIEEMPSASIPESWAWASAETVCESVRDGTHDTPEYVLEGVPLVTSKNLTNGSIDFDDTRLISKEDHIEISKRSEVENGDVLFAMIGTVGNPLVVKTDREFSIKNVGLFKKNDPFLDSKFLKFWLDSPALQKWLEPRLKGTTQKFAPLGLLRSLPIPVAPVDQQKLIVAEIEKQFSRLDEAVANLKRVKANLKRYKAAVLKAAVEGRLTEEWRKQHTDVEPASELLQRILGERRANWSGKGKYKQPKIAPAAERPQGWVGVPVEVISEIVDGDRGKEYPKQKDFLDEGYCLFLSTKNVRPYGFVFKENQFISKEKHEKLRKGTLKPGDIVFTSRGTIGNIAHYTEDVNYKCVRINSGMFILRGFQDLLDEGYFAWYLRSNAIRDQIAKLRSGTAQPQLPIREFKTFIVIFPSKLEQKEIVKEIERRISIIDGLESNVATAEKRGDRLRQSVLGRAFTGKLSSECSDIDGQD